MENKQDYSKKISLNNDAWKDVVNDELDKLSSEAHNGGLEFNKQAAAEFIDDVVEDYKKKMGEKALEEKSKRNKVLIHELMHAGTAIALGYKVIIVEAKGYAYFTKNLSGSYHNNYDNKRPKSIGFSGICFMQETAETLAFDNKKQRYLAYELMFKAPREFTSGLCYARSSDAKGAMECRAARLENGSGIKAEKKVLKRIEKLQATCEVLLDHQKETKEKEIKYLRNVMV